MTSTYNQLVGIAYALCAVTTLSLAACGGGSAAAPFQFTSGSAAPSPIGSPSSSPGDSPSPSPTLSSTPAPSASPTSSPISTPPPGLGATPTPIQLAQGGVLGIDTVGEGNTATGGQGQTVDGLTCNNLVTPYHVHAHVSLLVDGQRFAVPDVLGFFKPGAEVNGYTANAQCFYFLHTHDADGYIHIEGLAPTAFTLGELFDIWGEPLSSTAVAIFSGQVVAYTATAAQGFNQTTGPFTQYQGDVRALQLVSHEEIVLEIGPVLITPPNLPAVIFYTSK